MVGQRLLHWPSISDKRRIGYSPWLRWLGDRLHARSVGPRPSHNIIPHWLFHGFCATILRCCVCVCRLRSYVDTRVSARGTNIVSIPIFHGGQILCNRFLSDGEQHTNNQPHAISTLVFTQAGAAIFSSPLTSWRSGPPLPSRPAGAPWTQYSTDPPPPPTPWRHQQIPDSLRTN